MKLDHHASGYPGSMEKPSTPSRFKAVVTWVLSVVLAVGFVGAGASKLAAQPFQVQLFRTLGFPGWFMYVTGILEIAGAIALLIPRYAVVGAGIIICVMLGATSSLVTHAQTSLLPPTLLLLVLAAVIGYLRIWRRRFTS
jgi:putative oxidoreductase